MNEPYRECSQQTLDTALALERLGDREALRDHVRSFGCSLYFPRERLDRPEHPRPAPLEHLR